MFEDPVTGAASLRTVNYPEDGSPGVESEYARLATSYDRKWRHYVDVTAQRTMARLPESGAGRVLDVGCGTGVLLERLEYTGAGTFFVGLDPVPGMLAFARSRMRGTASLAMGRAESLPLRDETFDTVVSNSVLHYIGRPTTAFREAARVLKPGGRLILTDWCADFLATRLLGSILRIRSRPFTHIYRVEELKCLLEGTGFQLIATERYRVGSAWGLMTAVALKP